MNDRPQSTERQAFEQWFVADAMPCEANWFEREDAYPDLYKAEHVQSAWRGWAARAGVQYD